jgi:2-polyprenyl-3-methyl-5-hydroxy-6-metoxy-1,4-benzoquinol methylase
VQLDYVTEDARDCVLCGASSSTHLFHVGPYGYRRCDGCRLVRLSPRLAPQELGRYYSERYSDYGVSGEPLAEQLRNPTFAFRARRLERFTRKRSLFELGCGDGNFLAVMRARGWDVAGAEVSEAGARSARATHGIDVRSVSFDAIDLPARYDAIGLYHVLEHLYDPRAVLRALRRHLVAGGVLHMQLPNIRSLDGRLGRDAWVGLMTPQHVTFLEPAHVRRLLRDEGYEVLSISTYDPWHSPGTVANTIREVVRRRRGARTDAPVQTSGASPVATGGHGAAGARALAGRMFRKVAARGLALMQAGVGWGNVVDVVARVP